MERIQELQAVAERRIRRPAAHRHRLTLSGLPARSSRNASAGCKSHRKEGRREEGGGEEGGVTQEHGEGETANLQGKIQGLSLSPFLLCDSSRPPAVSGSTYAQARSDSFQRHFEERVGHGHVEFDRLDRHLADSRPFTSCRCLNGTIRPSTFRKSPISSPPLTRAPLRTCVDTRLDPGLASR